MAKEQIEHLPAQEESVEIELSAEELRHLSRPRISPRPAVPTRRFRNSRALIAGVASAAVVAACAAVWALNANAPRAVASPPSVALAAVEEPAVSTPPAVPEGPPVRIRNPFDKGEVFEFPPGTSEEEAHAAVADALMRRAMDRQALLDARPTKRRRAG